MEARKSTVRQATTNTDFQTVSYPGSSYLMVTSTKVYASTRYFRGHNGGIVAIYIESAFPHLAYKSLSDALILIIKWSLKSAPAIGHAGPELSMSLEVVFRHLL